MPASRWHRKTTASSPESRRRPDINFFDTAGTPAGALAAYDKAVASGADFVVGPLGRDEVDAVYGRQQLQVP
ncbi:hypothetical protein C7E14_22760, partial [Stenotrophomonas maltophilia]